MRNFLHTRWNRLSLWWRLQISAGLVLLLALLVLLLGAIRSEVGAIREDLEEMLAQKARSMPLILQPLVVSGEYERLLQAMRLHARAPDIKEISFTDREGTSVLALGNLAQWRVPVWLDRFLGGNGIDVRVPVMVNGRYYGEFLIEAGPARLYERLYERVLLVGSFLALVLLGCYGLLWWVVARSLAPLRNLQRGALAMAAGESGTELVVSGSEEIRQVMTAFNLMAGQVHQSQTRLANSEHLFRTALNGSRHLAALLDTRGQILMVNDTALSAVGYSLESLLDRPFVEGPWWQELPLEQSKLLDALEHVRMGQAVVFETRHILNGEERVIDFSIRPVSDEAGQVAYLLAEGIDVTTRQQAVAALEAMSQRFKSMFNAANVGIALTDPAGITVECNQALSMLLGVPRTGLLGRRFDESIHPEELDRVQAGMQGMLLSREDNFRLETRFLKPDGKVLWVDLALSVARQSSGRVQALVVVASDITARKEAERMAADADRVRQRLLDNGAVGIILCSAERQIVRINAYAERLLHAYPGTLPGQSVRVIHIDDEHYAEFGRHYQCLLTNEGPVVTEFPFQRADGSVVWCAISGAPLDAADPGKGVIWTFIDISERRRAEREREVSEQRLSLALEGAGLGMWEWHIPSGEVQFNARWASMLGYPPAELSPDFATWERLVHPADLPRAKEELSAYLNGDGKGFHGEHRLLHRDGHWVWVLVSGRIIERDDSGKPLRMVGIHVDISANKNAEMVVRHREQHLQALLSAMSDVVFLIDTAGRFSEFHWPSHTPYQPPQAGDFIGKDYNAFLPESATAVVDEAIARLMVDSGEPYSTELSLTLDGVVRCFHATFSMLTDAAGYPQGFLCVARDVTERKAEEVAADAARREIERLSQRNELLLNSAGDGIYGVDLGGRCTFINPAALELLGYPAEELIGRSPHHLFHAVSGEEDMAEEDCPVCATLRDGEKRETEAIFRHRNGDSLSVHMTVTPMQENGERVGAEVVFQDISLRKAMEQELMRLATTDSLTGLPNRRHFMEKLEYELARIKRFGKPACLLMLDLDHFKRVNDTYGHAAGDAVLRHFATLSQSSLREIDLIGRLGGEEFGVLLPGTDMAGALELAERLRLAVAAAPVQVEEDAIPVTVSVGVAAFHPADPHPDDILARADVALYKAKESGRNRVCQ